MATSSGQELFIILLIHWLGAGEMDLQVILGTFGHWLRRLWLRSLKNSTAVLPFAPRLDYKSNTPGPPPTRWPSHQDHCSSFFWSIDWGLVKWICRLFLGHLTFGQAITGRIVAQKSEKLTCLCPIKGLTTNPTLHDWVIWHLANYRVDCGSEVWKTQHCFGFAPRLGIKSNTPRPPQTIRWLSDQVKACAASCHGPSLGVQKQYPPQDRQHCHTKCTHTIGLRITGLEDPISNWGITLHTAIPHK
jgi:hypothetical protein